MDPGDGTQRTLTVDGKDYPVTVAPGTSSATLLQAATAIRQSPAHQQYLAAKTPQAPSEAQILGPSMEGFVQNYRAQHDPANAPQPSLADRLLPLPMAILHGVNAVAGGADRGAARIIRGATGQGLGPVPEDVPFLGQVVPRLGQGYRVLNQTLANHPELGGLGAEFNAAASFASPSSVAMLAGPAALKGAGAVAEGLEGGSAAGKLLSGLGTAGGKVLSATLPGAAAQGLEQFVRHPSAETAVSGIVNAAPGLLHGAGAVGEGLNALSDIAGKGKTALTEHPVAGGGPIAQLGRIVTDPLWETNNYPQTLAAARGLPGAGEVGRGAMEFFRDHALEAAQGDPDVVQDYLNARHADKQSAIADLYRKGADEAKNTQSYLAAQPDIEFLLGRIQGKAGLPDDLLDEWNRLRSGKLNNGEDHFSAQRLAYTALDAASEIAKSRGLETWGKSPEELNEFEASPEFQKMHEGWQKFVAPWFESSHASNGGVEAGAVGKYGYFPSIAETMEEDPEHAATVQDRMFGKNKNLNNFFATGLSDRYAPDHDAIADRLSRDLTRNGRAVLRNNMVQEGLGVPIGRFDANPENDPISGLLKDPETGGYTMLNPHNGERVRAEIMSTSPGFQTKDGEMVPPERMATPYWAMKELEPFFKSNFEPQQPLNAAAKGLASMSVTANPMALFQHMSNLAGSAEMSQGRYGNVSDLAGYIPAEIPIPGMNKTISPKRVAALVNALGYNLNDPATQLKMLDMTKAGVMMPGALEHAASGMDRFRENPLMGLYKGPAQYAHNALRTLDTKMRLGLWDQINNASADRVSRGLPPIDARARFDIMRTMGIYNNMLAGSLEGAQKRSGLDLFATAKMQQMRNGLQKGKTLVGMDDPWLRGLPKGERIRARAVAQLHGGLVNKAVGYALGNAMLGAMLGPQDQEDNRLGRVRGTKVSDPFLRSIPGQMAEGAYNAQAAGKNPYEGAALGAKNAGLEALTGNLGGAAIGAYTGKTPYLAQTRNGPEPLPVVPKGVDNNSATQLLYGFLGMNQMFKAADEHVRQWYAQR